MIVVYINSVACPLVKDDNILVNKRIADIQNPEQKTADWSRSFLILGSSKVNELFGHIFEVNKEILNTSASNFAPDFNPNLKAKLVVINDNVVVFTGYCQMNNIIKTNLKEIHYSINAYSTIGNFINDIRTKYLTDLDLSPYNHTISQAQVVSSWSATIGEGYVYPMIDYGYDTSYERWVTEYFKPAVYAKVYWEEIFADSGNSYESNFLNSDLFKRLIIPGKNEAPTLDSTTIYNNSFLVGRNTTVLTQTLKTFYAPTTADPLLFNLDTGTLSSYTLHNTSGTDYDTATGKWTCDVAGNYQLAFTIASQLVNNISGFNSPTTSTYIGRANIGFFKDVSGTITIVEQKPIDYTFLNSITSGTTTVQFTGGQFFANVGDVYYLGVIYPQIYDKYLTPQNGTGADIDFKLAINSAFSLIPLSNITYGQTLPMNRTIPDNILQVDFIMSIAKMFNLYFEEIEYRRYKIEPREDYFNSEIVDWTTKLDISQEVTITPMGANLNKQFIFSYQEDSDYLNNKYYQANKRVYGDYIKTVSTDFLTETKEIKPIFAASVLSCPDSGINNRIITDMRFANDDGSELKQGQYKLRILYYGGLLSCTKWNFRALQSTAITTGDDRYTYPYAGHLNNPFTPTLDLNYGSPLNVFYNSNIGADGNARYTDNNLYNNYWSKNINEITDKNSKVLEGYFYLNTYDWINIDFKKQYFIKDAYYRLLEVIDYDLTGQGKTKCRFLKTDKIATYVTSTKELYGGTDLFTGGGIVPVKPIPINKDGRIIRQDTAFNGSGGYNTAGNTTNKGTGNIIPFAGADTHVFASDNIQVSDARNFVFNSDSVQLIRPTAIFNGVSLEYKYQQNKTAGYVLEIDNSNPLIVLSSLDSNEYYQINKFFVTLFVGSDGSDLWANYTGTNKIQLLVNGLVTAEIAQADWIGEAAGTICIGTITERKEFGYPVKIQVTDEVTGQLNWKVSIFYNIITV